MPAICYNEEELSGTSQDAQRVGTLRIPWVGEDAEALPHRSYFQTFPLALIFDGFLYLPYARSTERHRETGDGKAGMALINCFYAREQPGQQAPDRETKGGGASDENDLEWLTHILARTYVSAYQKESHLLAEVPAYAERWRQLLSGADKESMKAAVLAAAQGAIGMLDVASIDWERGPQWSLP